MALIGFPQYRQFERTRVAANDAMMALLIGSRLGAHALSLAEGSPHLLGSMFPRVEEIGRFSRSVSDAQSLIAGAERHLTYMAIPYALAIYGGLLSSGVQVLRDSGVDTGEGEPLDIRLSDIHQEFCGSAGLPVSDLPAIHLELFEFSRWIRNRIVHRDGVAGSRLPNFWRSGLSGDARSEWIRVTKREPSFDGPDGRMELGSPELHGVLAVTKHLAEAANSLLGGAVPRAHWADIAVAHARAERGGRDRANELRSLKGFCKMNYGPLELTDDELGAALARAKENGRSSR